MKPVKRKEIVSKTARTLGIPEEIVDEIITHYYTTLQKRMSSMQDMGIYVPSLGTFVLKKNRLRNKIMNHEKIVKELDSDISMVKYDIIMKKKENMEKMKVMMEELNKQEERKKEYKELRKENE